MSPLAMTTHDIAKALDVSVAELWWVAKNMDKLFFPTRMQLVGKKLREIDAPKPLTKKLLRKLHRYLAKTIGAHPSVHGGARSRSCFSSARVHLDRRFLITRDVQDCYPSITQLELKRRLIRRGFRTDVALLLSLMCTVRGRVAQGSPVSCDALNAFLHDSDRALSAACARNGSRFSRTYDDMVVSVQSPKMIEWPGTAMRRQIENHGLRINARKLRVNGLQCQHHDKRVHNLSVNSKRGVGIVREQSKKAVALAESYLRGARVASASSIESLAYKRSQVTGWMYFIRQAEFGPSRQIRRLLEAGDRHISKILKRRGLVAHRGKWWVTSKARNEPRRLARNWRQKEVA